jgi:hypothetical protein
LERRLLKNAVSQGFSLINATACQNNRNVEQPALTPLFLRINAFYVITGGLRTGSKTAASLLSEKKKPVLNAAPSWNRF